MIAFFTVGVLPRRAIARALEMHIALPTFSSVAKHKFLSVPGEVYGQIHFGLRTAKRGLIWVQRWAFGVERLLAIYRSWALFFSCSPNDCADGNFHDLVRACASRHFLPFTVAAIFSFDNRFVKKIR